MNHERIPERKTSSNWNDDFSDAAAKEVWRAVSTPELQENWLPEGSFG